MREPLLHTGITDVLLDEHPLAWTSVYCDNVGCHEMLHASNNENMRGWVETGRGNYCLRCFQIIEETEDIEPYALPGEDEPPQTAVAITVNVSGSVSEREVRRLIDQQLLRANFPGVQRYFQR